MFEISWSELLILAIVTLVCVGPKDLPAFLRMIGKYAGTVKRQAAEMRQQFDAAMREVELDAMKKEVESIQTSVNAEVMGAQSALNDAAITTNTTSGIPNPLVPGTTIPSLPQAAPTAAKPAAGLAAEEPAALAAAAKTEA